MYVWLWSLKCQRELPKKKPESEKAQSVSLFTNVKFSISLETLICSLTFCIYTRLLGCFKSFQTDTTVSDFLFFPSYSYHNSLKAYKWSMSFFLFFCLFLKKKRSRKKKITKKRYEEIEKDDWGQPTQNWESFFFKTVRFDLNWEVSNHLAD